MAEGRLKDLGYFQKVDIQAIPDPNSPDKCILHVSVEEAPTAEAMVSASYSSTSGFGVDLTYNENNFFGTGKKLSVFLGSSRSVSGKSRITNADGSSSTTKQKEKFRFLNNVQVSVTDPHIFDKDMEGTVAAHRYVSSTFDGFNMNEIGMSFGLEYDLSSHFTQGWEYSLERRRFQDVDKHASPIILSQVQEHSGDKLTTKSAKNILSSIQHTIGYTTHFIRGIKGVLNLSLATTAAGVGGNARHLKNELTGSYSMPVFRRSMLSVSMSTGLLTKLGGREPHVADSFILGMDSFRGFEYAGVGPFASTLRVVNYKDNAGRDKTGHVSRRDFIGAKKYWKGTVEYTFPLGLPEELQFRGFVFTDFGTLWDAPNKKNKYIKRVDGITEDQNKVKHDHVEFNYFDTENDKVEGIKVFDNKKIRQSVGLGISFVTPFGPIKLTYAVPVRKGKYDESQRFLINMGTTF